jgi:hypothetical protein
LLILRNAESNMGVESISAISANRYSHIKLSTIALQQQKPQSNEKPLPPKENVISKKSTVIAKIDTDVSAKVEKLWSEIKQARELMEEQMEGNEHLLEFVAQTSFGKSLASLTDDEFGMAYARLHVRFKQLADERLLAEDPREEHAGIKFEQFAEGTLLSAAFFIQNLEEIERLAPGTTCLGKNQDVIENFGKSSLQSTPAITAAVVPPTVASQRDNLTKTLLLPLPPGKINTSPPGTAVQPVKSLHDLQTSFPADKLPQGAAGLPPSIAAQPNPNLTPAHLFKDEEPQPEKIVEDARLPPSTKEKIFDPFNGKPFPGARGRQVWDIRPEADEGWYRLPNERDTQHFQAVPDAVSRSPTAEPNWLEQLQHFQQSLPSFLQGPQPSAELANRARTEGVTLSVLGGAIAEGAKEGLKRAAIMEGITTVGGVIVGAQFIPGVREVVDGALATELMEIAAKASPAAKPLVPSVVTFPMQTDENGHDYLDLTPALKIVKTDRTTRLP